ncbi:unnamed protein product [Symbiodinium sp. CCMP2456]|nr:unnamed protein product [Symbiodinium sp. CCMP2456]
MVAACYTLCGVGGQSQNDSVTQSRKRPRSVSGGKTRKPISRRPGLVAPKAKGQAKKSQSATSGKTQRQRRDKPAGSGANREDVVRLDDSAPRTCGHTEFTASCAQCWFHRHGADWQQSHGSFISKQGVDGRSVKVVWLQQKPSGMPGPWAIGCAVCNAWSKKLEGHPRSTVLRRLSQRVSTKWARYEINKVSQMQASAVQLHAQSQIHIGAVKAFESPDLPLQALLPRSKADADLLKGAVPQPGDWLGAFRAAQSPVSFLKAEKQCQTAAYAAIRSSYTKRRQMKQMISVMVEVTRQKKRAAILTAAHISIAIDDRSPYRVVRFRTCRPISKGQGEESESPAESASPLVEEGILAVLNGCLPVDQMEKLDDDYSVKLAESIKVAIERLATPLSSETDQSVIDAFYKKVTSVATDGAKSMRKAALIMESQMFPNMSFALPDRAHQIRRASIPLTLENRFKAFWENVFSKRHALVPDLQNSAQWQMRFQTMENELKSQSENHELPGGLKKALRTLSFAKQRFDSMATPASKFVTLIQPFALLLAHQSADHRLDPKVRWRSQQMLQAMDAELVLVAGLSADFSGEVLRFVRQHDIRSHDISRTLQERDEFLRRLDKLFIQGHILDEATESFAHMACRNAISAGPIQFGDRMHDLWGPMGKKKCQDIMTSVQVVTDSCRKRVVADMSANDPEMAFAIFNLEGWLHGGAADGEHRQRRFKMLKQLCRVLKLPYDPTLLEFEGVLAELLEDTDSVNQAVSNADNRPIWARALGDGKPLSQCNQELEYLPELLAFYMSILDGECGLVLITSISHWFTMSDNNRVSLKLRIFSVSKGERGLDRDRCFILPVNCLGGVERDLASLCKTLEQHQGPTDADALTASELLELRLDGPKTESDVFVQVSVPASSSGALAVGGAGSLDFTDYSRACAQLWVDLFGRRFSLYKNLAPADNTDSLVIYY